MEISRQTIRERRIALIHHYLHRLDHISQMHAIGGDAAQNALGALDNDWHQLQTQQQWAVSMASKDDQAAGLVALFPDTAKTLLMQVDTLTAMQWIDDGLRWETDLRTRFRLATEGYALCEQRLDREHGRELLDEASAIAEALNDDEFRFEVLGFEIRYYQNIEDDVSQLLWAEKRLTLALQLGNQVQLAKAYHQLGYACCRVYRYKQAEIYLQKARSVFLELGMRFDEGITLNALAINAHSWGNLEQVLQYGEEVLAIFRQFGRRDWELIALTNLALFLADMGDFEKAIHYAHQGLAASVEANSRISEYTSIATLMIAYSRLGLAEETHDYLKRAQALQHEFPYQEMEEDVESVAWTLAHEQQAWDVACTHAEAMSTLARHNRRNMVENKALAHWGSSLLELGDFDTAFDVYQRALSLRDESFDNPHECARTLAGLSYLHVMRGDKTQGQHFFDRFMTLMNAYTLLQVDHPFMVAWTIYRAAVALSDSRLPQVIERIQAALRTQLDYLHESRLREAFLRQYSVRSLMKIVFSP